MKTTLTAASVCLLLSVSAHAEDGITCELLPPQQDPSRASQHLGELQDGMRWVFTMAREYTVYDQISIYGTLRREGKKAPGREFARSGDLVVVLRGGRENNKDRRKTMPIAWATGETRVGGGNLGSCHLFMEKMFGRLPAGKYSIYFEVKQIRSKTVEFEVITATLEGAKQKTQTDAKLKLELRTTKQGTRIARLKNTLNHQIIFSAYVNGGKQPEPGVVVSGIVNTQRWNPRRGWAQSGGGWCGTGLGQYILKPGETVDISVHPFMTGIIRHHLNASTMADGKRKAIEIFSEPFLEGPAAQ
ncbi:MAG: hypothetical protein V3T86_14160 [Planctomycetota bacterium]